MKIRMKDVLRELGRRDIHFAENPTSLKEWLNGEQGKKQEQTRIKMRKLPIRSEIYNLMGVALDKIGLCTEMVQRFERAKNKKEVLPSEYPNIDRAILEWRDVQKQYRRFYDMLENCYKNLHI